jgi:hypothetical protein
MMSSRGQNTPEFLEWGGGLTEERGWCVQIGPRNLAVKCAAGLKKKGSPGAARRPFHSVGCWPLKILAGQRAPRPSGAAGGLGSACLGWLLAAGCCCPNRERACLAPGQPAPFSLPYQSFLLCLLRGCWVFTCHRSLFFFAGPD